MKSPKDYLLSRFHQGENISSKSVLGHYVVKLIGNGRPYQTDLFATGWLIGRGDVWYRRIGDANDGWAAWSFDITVDQDLAWAFFWAAILKLERKIDVKWPKNVEKNKA